MNYNHFCHVCGGLVDVIGLEPEGARYCECRRDQRRFRLKIVELQKEVERAESEADTEGESACRWKDRADEYESDLARVREWAETYHGPMRDDCCGPQKLRAILNRAEPEKSIKNVDGCSGGACADPDKPGAFIPIIENEPPKGGS